MMTKTNVTNSVVSFLEYIYKQPPTFQVRCYRGQSDIAWDLKPSVMRLKNNDAEKEIFSELMVEAPAEFSADRLMFDKLVRAQHYGLPTRLLDVSLNPLVALYFACNEMEHHNVDGVVQLLDFNDDRVRFPDSDTISLICNLARLSANEKKEIVNMVRSYKKAKDIAGEKLDVFRRLGSMRRLTQFVRNEKPYFTDSAFPEDFFRYFFVYPAKNNRRVIAQSGAFVAAGLLEYKSPGFLSKSFKIKEIEIPHDAKEDILRDLDVLNINSRTMFPEIESTAGYIKQKWEQRAL